MPELPEVETMRRGIARIEGGIVAAIERTTCSRRPILISPRIDHLNKRVANQTILSVDRLGKRVVIRLASEDRIIIEPRMTGLVLIADPPTLEHLRVRIRLKNCPVPEVLFWDRRGLGRVSLWTEEDYLGKLSDGTIGPDALAIAETEFIDRFRRVEREVKVALLDQSIVLGIGNLYASEILHLAKIHPQSRCHQINRNHWKTIYQSTLQILNTAIQFEGSTLSDGTYRNSLNQNGSYQNEHCVYDRENQTCPTCEKGLIKRIVQAQRSTFYCPVCQKPNRSRVRKG